MDGRRAGGAERDAQVRARRRPRPRHGRDRDGGVVVGGARQELEVDGARPGRLPAARSPRSAARRARSRSRSSRGRASATGSVRSPLFETSFTLRVEGDQAGGRVLRRVGVGQRAADGRDVADAHGGDVAVDLGQQRRLLPARAPTSRRRGAGSERRCAGRRPRCGCRPRPGTRCEADHVVGVAPATASSARPAPCRRP